jgi:hypothetical protein
MNVTPIRMLLAAVVVGSGLAACGGSTTKSSTSGSPAPAGTSSASSVTAAGTTSSPAATGSTVTAPGTKLAVGRTAMVAYDPDYSSNSASRRLQITVKSIVRGSLADFHGITLDASEKAGTPVYVTVRITNVGSGNDTAGNNDPGNQIEGVDSTGQTQDSVTFIGDFPRCNDTAAPTPMNPGKSFETCLTFLVPGGISAAAYIGDSAYFNSPVTWR